MVKVRMGDKNMFYVFGILPKTMDNIACIYQCGVR